MPIEDILWFLGSAALAACLVALAIWILQRRGR
jgi:hypothetical protein